MANGYWNRVLRVDLSTGEATVEKVSDEMWKKFLGGAGYGAKVLLEETTADTDALSPDNPIIFGLGPYQTGSAPGNAKWTVVSKSPLTGTYADSAAGAGWGLQLKKAGYDALIIKGVADKPSYLSIKDDDVKFNDASGIWGLDSYETVSAIKDIEGAVSVACIGPAGENLVKFACIVIDIHSYAGRCGIGAVMGAKNLKAIAVGGTKIIPGAKKATQLSKSYMKEISLSAADGGLREHGTPELCISAESVGDMPIKNWSGDVWPQGAAKLGAPNYTEELNARPKACVNCPIGCHREITVENGESTLKGPGPEYETLGMLGSNLLIDDVKAVAKANDICNRLGMDTISAGACVGLAMESYEKGYLSSTQIGMDLHWGNADATLELLRQIGTKEGFGAIFARGALSAAKAIHPESEELVTHVKGLDLPAHDARACWSLAVNYATCTRGACHMRGVTEDVEMGGLFIPELGIVEGWTKFFHPENKSELTVKLQDLSAWFNSVVICIFMVDGGGLRLSSVAELFNSITGWDWGIDDIMESGERIINLQRLVNVRDGHSRLTDTLPPRMTEPAKEGFRAGQTPAPIEPYLDRYYELRQWDENGIPTMKCLERLGISEYADLAGISE